MSPFLLVRGSPAAGVGLALKLAVIPKRRAMDLLGDELADWHVRVEGDIERAEVDQLERDGAIKAGVDGGRGEVDQQSTAGGIKNGDITD